MREWVSINGRLTPADQAQVSAFDSGFLQGIGLFETMRAYSGRVFRLRPHLERLINSARQLGWAVLPDIDQLAAAVTQVVNATEQSDARVRLTVTTGTLRQAEREQPELTIVASASPGGQYPEEQYRKGATITICEHRQNPLDPTTGHKTVSYFARLASLREAYAKGAAESLWLTIDNEIAEGAISNIFLVKDGGLRTPPLDMPVLPGITRAAVLELSQQMGISAAEEPLEVDDLLDADEAFLTNSMMELMPVVLVDRQPIGSGKPGEVTARLREGYATLVKRECADAAV